MAKANIDNLIKMELEKIEKKVEEFQEYLEINPIVSDSSFLLLEEDTQNRVHKEITIQIKMQDALFNWLPLLEKLREDKSKKQTSTRGDVKVGGMFAKKLENNE